MEILKYVPEKLQPGVTLDVFSETFEIYGRSCPENAVEFYKPVLQWLDKYKLKPLERTVFELRLQYYNTASSKVIYAVLRKLESIHELGHDVLVKWVCYEDDEALLESIEEFSDLIDVPTEIVVQPAKEEDD